MAVKTKFTEEELAEILSKYAVGALQAVQPISAGTVQTNYCIQTAQGKFVFRYYENRSRESVKFECDVIRYLKAQNYPCPAVIKNTRGQTVGVYREKPYVLMEFIEGQALESPGEAQEKQLIQKVAELHHLTRHYRPRSWKQRLNYNPAVCAELAQAAAERIGTLNARNKLAWFLREVEKLDLPLALPKGICHCDFHFSNILFKDGAFAALIDFDDANYTYLVYDLVTLMTPFIRAFEWDTWQTFADGAHILDFRKARWVVQEYMQYRPLSNMEKRHMFDVFKLSVLLDCIWFYERGDASDFFEKRKIDALNRLGRERFYGALFP